MEFLSLKRKTFYELAELNKHTSVPLVKVDERSLKRLKTDERGSKRLKTDSCSYLSFNKCEISTDDVEQRTERIMFKDHEIKKESDTLIDIQTLQKDSEVSKSLHQDVIHEENQSRCSMMLEKHQIKKEVIPLEVTASDTNIGSKLRESMHQEYSSEERVVENGSKCSKMLEKHQIKKEVLPLDGMEKDINIGLKVSVEDEPKADERTEHSGRKLALENLHNPKITKGDINIGSKVGIKLEIKAEPQRYEHNEQNGRELVMENLCKLWINDCKIENGAVKLETNSNINSMNAFQGNVCKQELDISEEFESWDDGNVSEIQSSLIKKEKVPEMNEIESSENINAVDMKAKSREKNLIPGQQFILGIRGAHASGKSIFNCVLCFGSAVESSQNGPMFKRHIRSRQHALRVMEVENYPLYLEYKDSLLLDPELTKVILDYEDSQGRQTMVLATLLNYKKKRNTIEKKILLMKKNYPRLDLHHTVQSSTKDTNDRGTRSPCNRPSKVQESLSIKIDRESDSPCDNTSKVQEPISVKIGRGNGSPCSYTSKVQEPLSANTDRGTGSPCGGNPSKDQEPLSANVNGSPCDKVKETLSFKDNGGALVENGMGSRGVGYFGSVTSDVRSSPCIKKIERGEFAGQKKLKGEIIFNNNVDVSAVTSHDVTNELDCVIVEMEETANCHSKDTQEHSTKATKSDSDYEEEGIEEKTKKNSRKKIIEEQRMEGVAKSLISVNPVDESSQRSQIDQIVIISRKFCFKALSSIISDKVKVLNLKTLTLNSLLKHVNEMRRKRFLRKTLWLFTVGCAEWFETRPFYQCLINDPRCSTPLRFIGLSTRMNNVEKFVDKVVKRVERMTAGVRATLPSDSFFFVLPPMPLILYQFTMGRTHFDLHSRMRGCPYQCYVTMESERKKVLPAFRKLSDRISRLSIEGVDRSPFSPGVFEEYRSRVPMVDVETVASLGSGPALFKHWVTCISTFANQVFESGLCRSTSSMNGQPEPKSLSAAFPRSPESCTLDVRPERKSSFSVTIPRSPEPHTHDGQPEPKSSLSAAFPRSPESCTLDVRPERKSSFSVIPRSPKPHTLDGQPKPKSSISAAFPTLPESCTPDVRPEHPQVIPRSPEPHVLDGQPEPKLSLSAAFPRSPESCILNVQPERKSSLSVTFPRSPKPPFHVGQRSGTPEEHLIFLGSSKILKQIPSSENSAVSHWILQFPVDWPALNLQMSLESSSGPSLSFVILLDISAIGRKVPYRGCQELKCQNTIYFTSIEPSCCKLIKKRLAAVGKVIRAITKRYEGCNVVLVPPPPCCCILESTLTMKVRDRHAFLHKMMNSELGPELVSGGTKKKWREAVNVLVRRVENFAGVLKSECMAVNALMSNFASRWGAIEWVKGNVNQRVLPHSQLFLRELVRVLENGPRKSLLEFNRTLDEWIVSLTSKPPIGGTFEHAVLVGREGIFSPLRGLRGVTTMTVDLNSVDRDRFLWGLGSLPPDAVLFLGFELDAFLGEPSGLRSCKLNGCRSPIRVFGSRSILDRASVDYKVKTLVEFCEALRAIAPAVVVLLPLCPDKVYLLKEGVVSHEDNHSRLMGKRFVVCGDKEDWEGWLGYVVEAWNSRVKGFHGRDPILRVLPEYPVPGLTFRVVDSSLKDYGVESEGYWTWIWSYVWSLLVCLLRNGKSLLEAPARGSRDRANHVEPHSIGVSTWWGKETTEDWSRCSKSVASGIGAAIEGNLPSHDILPNREVPKASSLAGLLTPHSLPNGKTLNASSLTFRFTQDNILPNREAPKGLFRTPHDIPRNREAHKASSLTPHDIFDAMRKGIHSMEELYLEVRMGEVKRPWRMEDTEQWIQECLRVGYCAVSVRRLPVEVKVPAGQALSWVNLYMAAAGTGGGFRSWNTYHDLDGVWTLVVNGRLLDDVLESARQGVCNLMMTEIRLVDLRVRKVARTGATLPVEMTKVDRATSPTPPRTPLLGLMRPTPMLCDPYLQRNQTQGLLAVGGLCGEGETPPRFIIPRSVYYNW